MPTLTACPHCRTVAVPGQESCLRCGHALAAPAAACSACGNPHDERDRFCSRCGGSLTAPVEEKDEQPAAGVPQFLPGPQRLPRGLVASLAVFAALALAVTVLKIVEGQYFRPGPTVVAFFEALADRDAEKAAAHLAGAGALDSPLLRAAALRSDGYTPPSGVRVLKTETEGEGATVEAEFRIGETGHRRTFSLMRDDSATAALFYRWRIAGGVFPLDVGAGGVDTVLVAGLPVAVAASEYGQTSLAAFPGSYRVTLPEQPLLEAPESVVHVGASDSEYAAVRVDPVIRDGAREAVDQRVRAYLDGCAKQTTLTPAGCPFSSYSFGGEVRDVRWKIVDYPRYDLAVDDGGGVYLADVQYARAEVTGKSVSSYSGDTYPYRDSVSFPVTGTVTASNGTIDFRPAGD